MDERLDKIMKKLLYMVVCVLFTHTTLAQTLTGKVVDETNQPLPSVVIKNEDSSTYTNVDGEYTLNLSNPQSVVTFNFMGYKQEKVTT